MADDRTGAPAADNARQRLIDAAWQALGEAGPRGATTRGIAQRAGVNEVTVFRLFGSKDELLAAALHERTAPLHQSVLTPSEDVAADLRSLAQHYSALALKDVGVLLMLLPLLRHENALAATIHPVLHNLTDGARRLMQHHQAMGSLEQAHSPDHLVWEFLGPLFAAAALSPVLDLDPHISAEEHVRHFLSGHPAGKTTPNNAGNVQTPAQELRNREG